MGISVLGLLIPVLFLFFILTLLCTLSVITWAVFVASGYFFTMKPAAEVRK